MNQRTFSALVVPYGHPLLLTSHILSVLRQVTMVGALVGKYSKGSSMGLPPRA